MASHAQRRVAGSLMSVKKADNGRWRARVYHRGKQVSMATFDRKKDADAWELGQKTSLRSGTWSDPRNAEMTLAELIKEFLTERRGLVSQQTYDTDETNLRLHVTDQMKRLPIGSIDGRQLRKYVANLVRTKRHSTAKRIRESLGGVFAYAVREAYISHNPVLDAPLGRGDGTEANTVRPFTESEFKSMLVAQRALNPNYADIVEFLRETGLRWGEMKALRVRNVVTNPFLAIMVERSKSDGYPEKQTKGRRSRKVPLMGNAGAIAMRHADGKAPDAFLFRSTGGSELSGPNFTRDLRWKTTAGDHRVHDLRHTAATAWMSDGINVKTISVWLGHSTTQQTVNRYSHWMNDDGDMAAIARMMRARRERSEERDL
ncbi:hypothetical protein DEJ31_16520 [Curtobacterium sp. MCPF17_031]|nr:hypothetical protein DEJ31_16520 [Curtobacterium sp. MCPF17_031]